MERCDLIAILAAILIGRQEEGYRLSEPEIRGAVSLASRIAGEAAWITKDEEAK